MAIENFTANRNYQLPAGSNDLADDVSRVIAAFNGIDVDVAGILVSLVDKAAALHSHTIANVTGLQSALDASEVLANKNIANGYAGLDATGKVAAAYLPASIFGGLSYQAIWNANTNTPTIPAASAGNKGYYYKVGTAGATTIDGINDWKVGDWIVSNGTVWDKVDNTDQVASVAGLQGVISAAALKTALAMTIADVAGLQDALDAKLAATHAGTGGGAHANVVASGASGFMTGADKAKLNAVSTMANRAFTVSTSDPSGGANGDIHFKV